MMRKLIAGALLMGASTLAFAQPGCGVGAMIWKGQSGIAPHVLAATTNGTFGNQTFGMTTGTLGCQTNQSVQSMAMYMNSNVDKVARDMSRGSGENLDTLAVLLGVDEADRESFRTLLHDNFATIFPNSETTSGEAVDAIVALLEQDKTLSKYITA
jgi:ketosteroid isomerase-like protein